MIIRKPDYYKKFNCIGSACTDNCCIGWEIDIDDKTCEYYENLTGSIGDRFRKSIEHGEDNHFILNNERCPFLNKNNLCDIILTLGEDKLCDICTNHPRFYQWFDGLTEVGLGLCCEAAGKLIFEHAQPVTFEIQETQEESDCDTVDSILLNALFKTREIIFEIIQNRKISITERIGVALALTKEVQSCLYDGEVCAIYDVISKVDSTNFLQDLIANFEKFHNQRDNQLNGLSELIQIYQKLEPIDVHWTQLLADVLSELPEILENSNAFSRFYENRSYEYEHLLLYFIYRYFMKAVFDEDVLSKIHLAVASYLIIHTLDIYHWMHNKQQFQLTDRISIAKSYSKEIEYSQENLDILADESCTNNLFDFSALMTMLLS